MTWGDGPLNVWNLLLIVFLIGMLAWGVYADIATWRARSREILEEQAALARGDREAARRHLVHGAISLLGALVGLVVMLLGPRRTSREVWHAGWLLILLSGPAAVVLIRRGLAVYRKHDPLGRA